MLQNHGLVGIFRKSFTMLDCIGSPFVLLWLRIWIAGVFWRAGLAKIDSWESTLFLFELEYAVPILPYQLAALLATAVELGCSVLVFAGLMTRLAVIPMIGMSLVIQFVLGATNSDYDNVEHFYWLMILLVLLTKGAGMFSVDWLVRKFIIKK